MILSLDTATISGSIALVERDRVILNRYFDLGLYHAQHIFTEIEVFEGELGGQGKPSTIQDVVTDLIIR